MKRLLLTIPLLLSTMAVGPCDPVSVGGLDGGRDAPHDVDDARLEAGTTTDGPAGTGGAPVATGGAGTGGAPVATGGAGTGGTMTGGSGGAGTGGTMTGGSGGAGGTPTERLSCTPTTAWQTETMFTQRTAGYGEGQMVADATGGLHVALHLNDGALNSVTYAYRPPGGTWTVPVYVRDSASSNPRLAVDASYRTHMAWVGWGNADPLHYAVAPAGGSWTVSPDIDKPVLPGPAGADIVTDVNGNPQILVTGSSGAFVRGNGGTWVQQPIPNQTTGGGIVADSTGRTLLVYYNGTSKRVESVMVGIDGSLGTAELVASASTFNASVAVLPNDTFVVVFGDATGIRRATKSGNAAWAVESVAAAGYLACREGVHCLGVDGLGRLHTLIGDVGGVIRYAHTDPSGAWQVEPVDFGDGMNGVLSFIVDTSGVVHALLRSADNGPVTLSSTNEFRHASRCPASDGGRVPAPVAATAGTWQELPSAVRPPQRWNGQGMVFDSSQHEMVLFGGHDLGITTGQAPPETWTYPSSGTGWVRKALASGTNPGPRERHGMAFDSARSRVVLMGGGSNTDVWEWNGATATWSSRAAGSAPSQLLFAGTNGPATALAYDSVRSKMVVLLTGTCPSACWTLWDWDPVSAAFTARTSAGPQPGTLTSIAYDAASGLVIGTGAGGTWEWTPGTGAWTDRTGSTPAPTTGDIVATGGGRFAVYDGASTWEWARATGVWRQRTLTQLGPSTRGSAFIAFHPERATAWLFGGKGLAPSYVPPPGFNNLYNTVFDTTFEWHGASAAP